MLHYTPVLAADGFTEDLKASLKRPILAEHGRLLLVGGDVDHDPWAEDIWHGAEEVEIASIGEAAKHLRAIQRNWLAWPIDWHRRCALITEKLPPLKPKPLAFGALPPAAPLGVFTLLSPDRMLYAPRTASPFPLGQANLVEDKETPPNRAYLKLWEAFVRLGRFPQPGDTAIDLGASPGGWTYVLAKAGASVTAIDKAPLDPAIAAMPGVEWSQGSAFALEPRPVDWLVCDVICYPDRLERMIEGWFGMANTIIATIKLQGDTDHEAVRRFSALSGGHVQHLCHNKHELTFFWPWK